MNYRLKDICLDGDLGIWGGILLYKGSDREYRFGLEDWRVVLELIVGTYT